MQVTGLAMKVQQLVLSFWLADAAEQSSPSISSSSFSSSSLIMNLNRLSPLTSCKLASPPSATPMAPCSKIIPPLDLRILNSPGTNKCTARKPGANSLVETAPSGATRWIPMPEQIKVLEALYRSGMRSPKARQIEDITTELRKYGRIEGKNVFYWFQNHKARERQKQKRSALLALTMNSSTQSNSLLDLKLLQQEEGEHEMKEKKRRCRSWCGLQLELQLQQSGSSGRDQTLELFPLHPERKQDGIA